MRERLSQQQDPALGALDKARAHAEQAAAQKRNPAVAEHAKEQAADKLAAAARQLKDQSELREQHPQTNTQAALDQNRLGRAVDNLAQQMREDRSQDEVKQTLNKANQIAQAARTLQADATAQD